LPKASLFLESARLHIDMLSVDGKAIQGSAAKATQTVSKDELLHLIRKSGGEMVKTLLAEIGGMLRSHRGGTDSQEAEEMTEESMGRIAGLMAERASVDGSNFKKLGDTVREKGDKKRDEGTIDILSRL